MKRNLGLVVLALVVLVVAVLLLRRGGQEAASPENDTGTLTGPFRDDSLGVLLFQVPPDRGWTLHRDPAIPGQSVLTAEHRDGMASLKLFVTPADNVADLNEVVRRRRDHLASLFGIPDLDQAVARVLNEDTKERDGYPAMQWQAVSEPVDVAGGEPVRVLFMWLATLRQRNAYEGVGLLRVPVDRSHQTAQTDSLLMDMAFMLETMRFE